MRLRMIAAVFLIVSIMLLPIFAEFSAAQLLKMNYTAALYEGVLSKDRVDFKKADNVNGSYEDTANFVYQGRPAVTSGIPDNITNGYHDVSAGYMNDLNLTVTNLATIVATYGPIHYSHVYWHNILGRYVINYTGTLPLLHLFPPNPQPPPTASLYQTGTSSPTTSEATTIEKEPIEGWFLSFNVTPPGFPSFTGVMVVTYGGFNLTERAVVPQVIYNATTGRFFKITGVDVYTIDNPRLLYKKFVIHLEAKSLGSEDNSITLYFNYTITISFVKSTKQVNIHEYVTYKAHTYCCIRLPIKVYYGRIAVIGANAHSTGCRSFYGWTNFTLPKCSCEKESLPVFLVLSWVNRTLDSDFASIMFDGNPGNVSYAVYMAAFPFDDNFTYAISSVLHDRYVAAVWRAVHIDGKYVYLKMDDEDNDGAPDGDMALIRFQWEKSDTITTDVSTGWSGIYKTPLATIVYGVYNINATRFVGGVGGVYDNTAMIYLYNNYYEVESEVSYNNTPLASLWPHTVPSELLFLETGNTSNLNEAELQKVVSYVDLNNDGKSPIIYLEYNEINVPVWWLPVSELLYQLYTAFQGPCFSKLADFNGADFIVTPASSVVPADTAGVAWLQGVLKAQLVTFDIDLKGAEIYFGAAAPGRAITLSRYWRMPFILLKLNASYSTPLWLNKIRSMFATPDRRYFLQMEPFNWNTTPWRDVHYLVVSVAGPRPNAVTWYFNDYAQAVYPLTGPITKEVYASNGSLIMTSNEGYTIVLLPNGDMVPAPTRSTGYAVVAVAKDVFNNTALLVWGLRAADTYWAAYWVAENFNKLLTNSTLCSKNAIVLKIDYGGDNVDWRAYNADGTEAGLPLGKPPIPQITICRLADNLNVYS